jgi:hypothetical protein
MIIDFKFFRGLSENVIVGRKGRTVMDIGYVYAPYIPVILNPYERVPLPIVNRTFC